VTQAASVAHGNTVIKKSTYAWRKEVAVIQITIVTNGSTATSPLENVMSNQEDVTQTATVVQDRYVM
jgi:hypothetical protein